ncbi:hypothetical protein K7432_002037 [Basidiobolus ranarum]|uniref:Carbohydrate kinase PfkB domain-containing protein n=1 Tax=Basidiobolus ranarum TaxID=34480 RepID=A0ABR2W9C1_9FUNG
MALHPRILAIGSVYLDIILEVPYYPEEDSKLRSEHVEKRRGGNSPNTLVVLSQLFQKNGQGSCHFMGSIASLESKDNKVLLADLKEYSIDLDCCLKTDKEDPPTSYIVATTKGTRTIINHNPLPDVDLLHFKNNYPNHDFTWVHVEGRNIEAVSEILDYLIEESVQNKKAITTSIEIERPESLRPGITQLQDKADVVFYSKIFAQSCGFEEPQAFLKSRKEFCKPSVIAFCTWGSKGAAAYQPSRDLLLQEEAYPLAQVVSSVGAGDTFNAGVIYALSMDFSLQDTLKFACKLASLKCGRSDFSGLGQDMSEDL